MRNISLFEENVGIMDFYSRVRFVCKNIPYGKAASYGQIAAICGKPKNARQVGYVLKFSVDGDFLPAHRVVGANGIMRGAMAFETANTQRIRLEKEGVSISEDGKVDLKKYGWQPTADEIFNFMSYFENHYI